MKRIIALILFSLASRCYAADQVLTVTIPDAKTAKVRSAFEAKYQKIDGETMKQFLERKVKDYIKDVCFEFDFSTDTVRYQQQIQSVQPASASIDNTVVQ